jgi:HEAT repeat protein
MNEEEEEYFTRASAAEAFKNGSAERICSAMVAVALSDPDWKWSQDQFLELLQHENVQVRALAATCLGHVARVHQQLDKEIVLAALKAKANDKAIEENIKNALDDIRMFLK